MSVIRKAPVTGFVVEEHPQGLYLLGNLEKAKETINDRDWRVTHHAESDTYLVEIAYLSGFDPNNWQSGVAEWGRGSTLDEAWRYALGAAVGSYEDEVIYKSA